MSTRNNSYNFVVVHVWCEDILSRVIGRLFHTTSESRKVWSVWVKVIHNTERKTQDFMWKLKSGKNHEEEEKNPL